MVDPPLNAWIASHPDVVAVQYHVNHPYAGDPFYLANVPEQHDRELYYLVARVPAIHMDGPHEPAQWLPADYENLYQQRRAIASRVRIELAGEYDPVLRTGLLAARVVAEAPLPAGDWRLRVAVVENGIQHAAPNGITIWDHIFRRFVPDTTGTALVFAAPYPDTARADLPFALDAAWADAQVELIAFLQDEGSREIEQGAAVRARDLVAGVEESAAPAVPPALVRLAVRPNPFTAAARLDLELARGGRVIAAVHDAGGRRLRVLVDADLDAGPHALVWDGRDARGRLLPAGVYFIRIAGPAGAAATRAAGLLE